MPAQQALDDEGGAGIDARAALAVEAGDQVEVVLQGRGQRFAALGREQAGNAVGRFAAGLGEFAVEPVQAGAGMGVEHRQGRLLLRQVGQHGNEHGVLEHVGVVAGMEGVAVTEHVPMVTGVSAEIGRKSVFSYNGGLRSDFVAPRRGRISDVPPGRVPSEPT